MKYNNPSSSVPFNRIPILLKRYSFHNKMKICQNVSINCIEKFDFDKSKNPNYIFPWEIEIFALFSIMTTKEYNDKILSDYLFTDIINSIRHYVHPQYKNSEFFKNKFFMATLLRQIKYQENKWLKLYRFNYIFNYKNSKIDMKKNFNNKFGCNFIDYTILVELIDTLLKAGKSKKIFEMLSKVFNDNQELISPLVILREDFYSKQKEYLINGIDSYYYAFNLLNPYPFIHYEGVLYLPLPHLLIDSITSSFLYRITENNDRLRESIGKEVIESYLLMILKQSNVYKEVVEETNYKIGRKEILSPDVMVCKEDKCALFDCKLSVPSVNLRNFDEDTFNNTINRCALSIKKTYDRVMEFGKHYRPFKYCNDFKKENIFGVVVWLEDTYVPRHLLYKKVAEIINEDITSKKMKYIMSNIKLTSMKDIEESALLDAVSKIV